MDKDILLGMSKELDKALKDYEPVYNRPTPVRYDVLQFSEDHRRMDALLRRHYSSFHPLVQDIFTSFSLEFEVLLNRVDELEKETEEIKLAYQEKQKQLDEDLDDRLVDLKEENDILKEKLEQYQNTITQLEDKVDNYEQILKEKDAVIVTQRRQLDLLIEKEMNFSNKQQTQEETLSESIEHVNEFTNQLELIEVQMSKLEQERDQLKKENEQLKDKISETESQYISEIEDINQLYSELKQEFEHVVKQLDTIDTERQKLKAELEDQSNQDTTAEDMDQLLQQNQALQDELLNIKLELENKNAELQQLQKKNNDFRNIAKKLLTLRDKIDLNNLRSDNSSTSKIDTSSSDQTTEKKIVHPANNIHKRKKWHRKKTALEEEIEDTSVNERKIEDHDIDDTYKLIDKDLNLDESVNLIKGKLEKSEAAGHDLIKSIRESTQEDGQQDLSSALLTEIDKVEQKQEPQEDEDNPIVDVDAETSSNFEKVLAKLEGSELNSLGNFAADFPKPPENKNNQDENNAKQDARESLKN